MPAIPYGLVLNTALYALLAYCALLASITEKQAGHEKLCRHHRAAAVLYGLLGAAQVLHG